MRAALFSLALSAGSVIAAPGKRHESVDTTCTDESTSTPVYSATWSPSRIPARLSSSSYSFPSNSSSHSHAKGTAPIHGSPSVPAYGPTYKPGSPLTTVTELTTIYTTVCPATQTGVKAGTTTTRTYHSTSTITSIYTATLTLSSGSPVGPGGYGTGYPSPAEGTTKETSVYGTAEKPTPYETTCTDVWTTVPWGTTWFSYTIPASWTETTSATATAAPYPTGGSSSRGAPYPSGSRASHVSKSRVSSISKAKPSGSRVSSIPNHKSSGTISPSSSTSTCTKPTSSPKSCTPCEGQPGRDPAKWCGYTVHDNSYEVMPITCNTVTYNLEITNGTVAPDGISRIAFLINGGFPGPLIEANWGDTIVVNVKNQLQNNGSSVHFHGMRQLFNNEMDGVPSITQCPIAPGESMTYTFKASNYGTSWYHSHFALQTYEGVFGPVTIHGPASDEDYDEEQSIVIQDWSHHTVDAMYDAAQTVGPAPEYGPRTLDTGLINGMNVFGVDGAANATGKRFTMNVESGKKYRLRLVNTAIQSTFKFYIDNHKFKVIAADFVPIVPYETEIVNINIGQRYDLIFTADQLPGNYWMRADNQNACASMIEATNVRGIVSYLGQLGPLFGTPTSNAYNYTDECIDEPLASLVPVVALNAGAKPDESIDETVVIGGNGGTPNLYKWTLSGTTFQSQWGEPTLQSIVHNGSIPTFSGKLAIEVPKLKEWVYVIIDSPIPLPHPIHLHGHDFFILAQGKDLYNSNVTLNTINPPRRDVALMPWDPVNETGGHLVLAFETDNPGAWLMHCHIGWHVSMGFALQIIEGTDLIKKEVKDSCQMDDTCKAWNSYMTANGIITSDSGV